MTRDEILLLPLPELPDGFHSHRLVEDGENTHFELFHNKGAEIRHYKEKLDETDYQAIKHSEGQISEEEYMPIKTQRQAWRDRINELEQSI